MAEVLLLVGIGLLLLCIFLTLIALLIFSGLFESIEIGAGKPPLGEVVIAYKAARGPYKESGKLFNVLSLLAPAEGHKAVGIYYDDPQVTEAKDLRYIVGAVVEEDGKEGDPEFRRKLVEEEGFKLFRLPNVSFAVRTEFPYKSSLSIFVAVARVYPKLDAYIKEHRLCAHPCLEIYDGAKIQFMAPLAKQSEFYVSEVQEQPELNETQEEAVDESVLDDSVSHSEASATTFMGSFADDDSPDELDELDSTDISFSDSKREKTPSSPSVEKEMTSKLQPSATDGTKSQVESENVASPDLDQKKMGGGTKNKDGEASDGNDSGSSFEELVMDEQTLAASEEPKQSDTNTV